MRAARTSDRRRQHPPARRGRIRSGSDSGLWLWILALGGALVVGPLGVGLESAFAAEWRESVELRIAARPLVDGRVEFALQQRAGGDWGERLLPQRRFFPADAAPGQWLVTSALGITAESGASEFRIAARRLTDGRTEFAMQQRTGGVWAMRLLPERPFLPATASVGRWHPSSVVRAGVAAPEDAVPGGYRGSTTDGRLLGETDARVRITVFEDFACSFCRTFGRDILPLLEEEFIRPAVVSLEFIHMAILGDYSVAVAAASECASDQGLFWQYHDTLIAHPLASPKAAARELNATLGDAGLDREAFAACVDADTHTDAVLEATAMARALLAEMGASVIGVPTFLVNGQLWRVGLPTIDDLRAEIARIEATSSGN